MSTTLTNGLKLPDKGSVDWYADMQSNYTILDGAVGTIAEHSTQIAGKAPAVHTHTKSDITDFPAYGTTAGTICEGNDSRLSDARTPVAHTHTKSDVTDLLNSNFIPSANNSYDLGSSSYQWNNLYAKNYYYNGTAWGLDKYNQWTGVNDFNNLIGLNGAELWFKNSNIDDITANPSADTGKSILQVWNKGTTQYCGGIIDGLDTSGTHVFEIVNFGYPLNSTNAYQHRFRFASKRDGTASFYPTYPNVDLGTSTNKWKTLNGINPGALSLPNLDSTKHDPIDFSQWNVSLGFGNTYVPQSDGWLYANIKDSPNYSIFVFSSSNPQYAVSAYGNGSQGLDGRVALIMPVRAGVTYTFMVKASSVSDIYAVTFFPALGNV